VSNYRAYDVAENGQRQAMPPKAPKHGGFDPSLLMIKLGGWLAVAAFGGLFWLVNGGFSVRGLEVMARAFGTGGAIFWGFVSAARLPIGGGLPAQPIVPWVGVIAATLIQIGITLRLIQGRGVPFWVGAVGLLLSGYDVVTTFFGFGTLQWVQRAGLVAQLPLTVVFTFGLEVLIGFLLRHRR
jgi:hypothetical protein